MHCIGFGVILMILILIVAFQFALLSQLPNVPYSTFIDYYIQFSFCFVFLKLIYTSLAITDVFSIGDHDKSFLYVFSIFLFCTQCLFVYFAFKKRKFEIGKLEHSVSAMKEYSNGKKKSHKIMGIHKFTKSEHTVRKLMGL